MNLEVKKLCKYPCVNMFVSKTIHKINRITNYISNQMAPEGSHSIVRPMIEYIHRNNKHRELVGLEIGVQHGLNMQYILDRLSIKKLYLIEPHLTDRLVKNLKETRGKAILIEKFSEDAVDDIPDNLDFVYIDGNHNYDSVKNDIELYYPKVIEGGVIGGHDYDLGHPGLCCAVNEFILRVAPSSRFCLSEDWWIITEVKK